MVELFQVIYSKDWKKQRKLGNVSVLREFIPTTSEQELRLYESLNSILSSKVYNLLEFENVQKDSIDNLFLLPYDRHPSKLGAEWYGNAIVKVLTTNRLLDQK